ncbi:hypothetical protein GQ44DRAFT_718256 [Phaeosphaeriaceae sp. PMI808]|nr:hypothetical protein GQ44DRAFT_718256 [Phaeosphaeriaceae sp. PMI808]
MCFCTRASTSSCFDRVYEMTVCLKMMNVFLTKNVVTIGNQKVYIATLILYTFFFLITPLPIVHSTNHTQHNPRPIAHTLSKKKRCLRNKPHNKTRPGQLTRQGRRSAHHPSQVSSRYHLSPFGSVCSPQFPLC